MKKKWIIFIAIMVLWLFGGIGLIMSLASELTEDQKIIEITKIAFLLLGGLGVILPTYLNIWQSLESSELIQAKLDFDKMENTFRILEKWDDPSLLEARKFTRRIKEKKDSISNKELLKEIQANETLKQSVIMVFNYWEGIRVSIEGNRINEAVLQDSISGIFNDMYERFKPWMDKQPSDMQEDFRELYQRWA